MQFNREKFSIDYLSIRRKLKKLPHFLVVLFVFGFLCASFLLMDAKRSLLTEMTAESSQKQDANTLQNTNDDGPDDSTSSSSSTTTDNKNLPMPLMHTFWEPVPGGCCGADEKGHEQLLQSWRDAWHDNGWHTNLINENDAKKHPDFDKLENLMNQYHPEISEYDKRCFYRWLAMATLPHGGWMSDYDLLPLNFSGEESYKYVEKNGNGRFTSYANIAPALVYGSKDEWQRLVDMFIEHIPHFKFKHFSDMYVFKELVEAGKHKVGIVYDTDTFVSREGLGSYKEDRVVDCDLLKGEKAIHFSHFSTYQARDRGVFPIKEGEAVQNRGLATAIFMKDYKEQCVFGKKASSSS